MNSLQNQNVKNYNMLVEFAQFLRQNGDKLFEKDSKLSLKSEQIYVLQEYLHHIVSNRTNVDDPKSIKRKNTIENLNNTKEFILLYKSNQLHLIQDFLFKITCLKITSDSIQNATKDYIKLNIFGSLTYLEIKNVPILNIYDLGNLRKQLENLIANRSVNKLQDLIHLCGADQSSPLSWPKLHTLNISYNAISSLDNSLRLTTSIQNLDLSHNNLKTCELFLHNLPMLKRLNISFNKLEQIPNLCETISQLEYMDISYNNIEFLSSENLSKLNSLKHINLSHNIISNFTQLNHLRILPNIKEILLDANPIKLNSNCDGTIKEILNVVKVKNSLKKTPQTATPTWSNYQPRMSQPNLPIRKLSKKASIRDSNDAKFGDNQILSAPNSDSLDTLIKQNKIKRRSTLFRLKPNNILIEQSDDENQDYLIIKKKNESDSEQESNQLSSSLLSNYLQPDKLQNELEYYKSMRQKYGTGWLSVLPNEANEQALKVKNGERVNEIVKKEINTDKNQFNNFNLNIIETFLVYKTIDINQIDQLLNTQTFDDQDTNVSILCLDERFLIEKDETNSIILTQYEYSNISEILDLSKIKKFVQDTADNEENKNKIKIKFKDLSSSRTYEFENSEELNSFINCISEILLNKTNLEKCDLYYCVWCKDFGKKSKFIFDDSNENLSNEEVLKLDDQKTNLTCTKCHKYLIKDSILVSNQKSILTPHTSREGSPNREDKHISPSSKNVKIDSDSNSLATTHEDTVSLGSLNHESVTNLDETIQQRVNSLLSNSNQISKNKLEEITNRAKKIKNNLKLYLIINVLGEMKKQEGSNEDHDENLLYAYRLKYLFFSVTKLCDDCLCVFTDRHLIVFQINDSNLFNQSIEFEKCITKVACIEINQIEIIEIACAQNYLILNVVNSEDAKLLYKLVTNDVYLNQTLLNSLLKTINESKKVTMLKQIKKKNEVTNKNLEEIVNLVDNISLTRENEEFQIFSSRLNLFLYIDELKINGKNYLIEHSNYENFSYEMFTYNSERILLVEENLSYVSTLNKNEQFTLIDSARISDIVQLKLFKEDENRIEISIVDESNNSVQVNWLIRMNKAYQLSQFISLVKEIWEKIFYIELPMSF